MIATPLLVTYADGSTDKVVASHWAIEQWSLYCVARKLPPVTETDVTMAAMSIRYMAYAELHRRSARRPDYDTWSREVDCVDIDETSTGGDPTAPATSDISSPVSPSAYA
jgi:hypothetical protein